jgi:hypothetical protein
LLPRYDLTSRQLVEQRLGVLQDRRVETFGEPAVDEGEEIPGFRALARRWLYLGFSRMAVSLIEPEIVDSILKRNSGMFG